MREVGLQKTSLTSYDLIFHVLLRSALNSLNITAFSNWRRCGNIC